MLGLETVIIWALSEGANTVAQGLVGNRADALICQGLKRGWKKFRALEATDPVNHDLQRAARAAYLKTVREMAEVSGVSWAVPAIKKDIDGLPGWFAEQEIAELDVLLVSEEKTAEQRLAAFRNSIDGMLAVDARVWGGEREAELKEAFERFVRLGWGSEAKPRTFHGVMTMHFLEEVKGNQPARDVLQTQLLAEIANQDRALAPVGNLLSAIEGIPDLTVEKMLAKLQELGLLKAEAAFAKLDRYPASFVDRPKLRGWLEERINEDRNACLLWGGPGTGKSTLALEVGYRAHEAGRTVVQQFCGPDRGWEQVGVDLAAMLPGDDEKAAPKLRIERALRWLRERKALVILDDIWDEEVTKLAPGPPAFTLFTSRRADAAHLPEAARRLAGGFEPDESEKLIENRLPGWLATDGEALRAFARRVEHLPYALEVAVRLMEGDPRPRAQAVERVRAAALQAGELDLDGLLREAVGALPEASQKLLHAVALCAPEGVWLPFAGEVAGVGRVGVTTLAHITLSPLAPRRRRLANTYLRDILGTFILKNLRESPVWTAAGSAIQQSLLIEVDRETGMYRAHAELRRVLAVRAVELTDRHADTTILLYGGWDYENTDWRIPLSTLHETKSVLLRLAASGESRVFGTLCSLAYFHCIQIGRRRDAYHFMDIAKDFYSKRDNKLGLSRAMNNQANILEAWGRLQEAFDLHRDVESIRIEIDDRHGLIGNRINQAKILSTWGRREEAMRILEEQEAASAEIGAKDELQVCLGNRAMILSSRGRLDEAMELHKREEAICRELQDQRALLTSLRNQALILVNLKRLDEAMEMLKNQAKICTDLGHQDGLAAILGNQGVILQKMGHLQEAMTKHEHAGQIYADLEYQKGLATSWMNQSQILQHLGEFNKALALNKKSQGVFETLGDKVMIAGSLENRGSLFKAMDRRSDAIETWRRAEVLFAELGMVSESEKLDTACIELRRQSMKTEKGKHPSDPS